MVEKQEKTQVYLLSIVGIVAVVGVVVLLLNGGRVSTQVSEEDVAGLAITSVSKYCTDTDGGLDYATKGTIFGGLLKTTGKIYTPKPDSCNAKGQLLEGFCVNKTYAFYVFKNCTKVPYNICYDGACVLDSDSDTVPDSLDVCEKGDDTIDSDSDGIPDCAEVEPCTENLYLGETLTECESLVESTGTFTFAQDDDDAPVADMYLFIDYMPDEVYLAEGESTVDPSSGKTVTVSSIENDDYETIEFLTGSTSGEVHFTNNDGINVEIPLAADSSFTSGEASDEPIFWGGDAPSSTVANQDELVYLENEVCTGQTSVDQCVGAMFLVVDASQNAHLVQITNIDVTDNEINYDDLTYGTTNDNMPYTEGSISDISLTSAGNIQILVDESAKSITFTTIGSSDGATITTDNGATLEIVNTDTSTHYFEGLKFSEKDDGEVASYLEDFEITAVYDDVTDNSIEFGLDSVLALGTSEGFGLFDFSDTNDDDMVFMTYKGSLITYDREDQKSLVIEHPKDSVYAVVSME